MREFLDDILEFIGAEALTDQEFEDIELADELYDVATYRELKETLESRGSVSDTLYRLAFYFLGKGVSVATVNTSAPLDDTAPKIPTSQILIGIDLGCG